MRFLPGNAQHIGARQSQQDSFGFADPSDRDFIEHAGFLAIVCDGMGGMEHGDAASRTAVRAFLDAYRRKTPQETIPAALERSVLEANASVVELARRFGMVENIGTTLVATSLIERAMFYISVGDSGIFHVGGGQIRTVNRFHVFANLLDQAVARGQLTREDALAHPERESLTSYIGAEKIEEIDRNLEPLPLADGDTVLLASDGMFKTLEPGEILACLRGNPPSWPDTLVEHTLAKQREYQDNVTVLSVTYESEARAAVPRTVLLAPPPPGAAGVPPEPKMELPRTGTLPMTLEPAPPRLPPSQAPAQAIVEPTIPQLPALPPPPPLVDQAAARAWQPPLPAAAPARRSPVLIVLIVALVAGVAAGGWWYWSHRPVPNPLLPVQAPHRDPDRPFALPRPDEAQPPPRPPDAPRQPDKDTK